MWGYNWVLPGLYAPAPSIRTAYGYYPFPVYPAGWFGPFPWGWGRGRGFGRGRSFWRFGFPWLSYPAYGPLFW